MKNKDRKRIESIVHVIDILIANIYRDYNVYTTLTEKQCEKLDAVERLFGKLLQELEK